MRMIRSPSGPWSALLAWLSTQQAVANLVLLGAGGAGIYGLVTGHITPSLDLALIATALAGKATFK